MVDVVGASHTREAEVAVVVGVGMGASHAHGAVVVGVAVGAGAGVASGGSSCGVESSLAPQAESWRVTSGEFGALSRVIVSDSAAP